MKKFALIFGVLLCCSIPRAARAQTYSTSTGAACGTSVTSCATTTGISISSGNFVAVIVVHSGLNSCATGDTITDSGSVFTFASVGCVHNTNTGGFEAFWGLATGTAASDLFTVNLGATTNNPVIVALKYTGTGSVSAVDTASFASSSGSVSAVSTTGPFSTAFANEVILQCATGDVSTTSWTSGSIGTGTGTVRITQPKVSTMYVTSCQDLGVSAKQSGITAAMTANAVGNPSDPLSLSFGIKAPVPVISPSAPSVNPGDTISFSCSADCGTPGANPWSISTLGPCTGSINTATGAYTAAATCIANNSLGGYPLGDNASVFNTDISGLSARADSATILGNTSNAPIDFLPEMAFNYATSSTPTDSMVFLNTATNNGTYTVPQWPSANIQNGWFDARVNNGNADHHLLTIRTDTGSVTEFYQYYAVGTNVGCLTCNSQGGRSYTAWAFQVPDNTGGVNAANLDISPLVLKRDELVNACENGGTINHALQFTLSNGAIRSNANPPVYLWPAFNAFGEFGGANTNWYGERVRLKASFAIGTFSSCAQKILTALKNYGMLLVDGGFNWQIGVEYGTYDATVSGALKEITAANIAGTSTNFEIVDESGLEVSGNSSETTGAEQVSFTSTDGTTTIPIIVKGTAVNCPQGQVYVMAGASSFQLNCYSNAGGITYTMSPTVGTLTSGGLYTAPATEASFTSTTVTATSAVNGSVVSTFTVNVCPQSGCYLLQSTSGFTDSHGNVWAAAYGIGSTLGPNWQGCCQNNASFPAITDKQLFWNHYQSSQTQNDWKMDVHVPTGQYTVTYNLGTTAVAGSDALYFYTQGALVGGGAVDPAGIVGQDEPYTLTQSRITVNNGVLSLYNAGIGKQATNGGDISSLSIVQSSPIVPSAPTKAGLLLGD